MTGSNRQITMSGDLMQGHCYPSGQHIDSLATIPGIFQVLGLIDYANCLLPVPFLTPEEGQPARHQKLTIALGIRIQTAVLTERESALDVV
jgi:hypothetical protein